MIHATTRRWGPGSALVLVLTLSHGLAVATVGQTVWVEGEKPTRSTMNRHPFWYDQVQKEKLSGGDWISNFDETKPGAASYKVAIPKAGNYALWARLNPVKARVEFAIDGARPVAIDLGTDVLDTINLAAAQKPDLRFLGWKKIGAFDLRPGDHRVDFRFFSEAQNHGGLDAFVFTTEPFLPSGATRPGQTVAGRTAGDAGTWPFLPERDTFRPDALLDLRDLNEKTAGATGFVKLSPDGSGFALGDGTPVRFWPVTTYVQRERSAEDLAHHARFLAKRGVNMVRYHGHLEPKDASKPLTEPDAKALDELWKLVAAMKKEGIYTTFSPYWAANFKKVSARWGIDGWPEDQSPQGLLFFNPTLQAAYKAWLKAALSTPNPYTGVPLAKDPALAIIQVQNEDSLLFWTSQAIKGKQLELLGARFADWAKKKYGSIDAALLAWDGDRMPEDDPSRDVLGVHIVWEMTQPRAGGRNKRLSDQLEFLTRLMFDFNREIARYLRDDLGCKQLINAGNWRTADTVRLNDAERMSYTANEVLAVNFYYSPTHVGPDQGWRIGAGDRFEDASVLLRPRELPLNLKQVVGHPMLITESHWVPPLGYQSEGPFLVAAYQSLTGLDGFYWFATGEAEWSNQDRSPWDSASRAKWNIGTPEVQGQFPAAAFLYRKGLVREGAPALVEHRSADDVWGRKPPLIAEDAAYDPNRDLGDTKARTGAIRDGIDPLAFLVGPVQVVYGSDASKTRRADIKTFIDREKKIVRSNTGELTWDHGRGVCTLDAPGAQGASGFLKAIGPITLRDVTIRPGNDYATVLVVALDGQPLRSSRKVLVQVGTRARPTGWAQRETEFTVNDGKETRSGFEVVDTGRMPWAIDDTRIALEVRNPLLRVATLLDLNGNKRGTIPAAPATASGAFAVALPRDAMYAILSVP
jgi:hypothetical protein